MSLIITACGGGKQKIDTAVETSSPSYTLSGVAQKGPAQSNTTVVLHALDHRAKRTGAQLVTKTSGKQGAFTFQVPVSWQPTVNKPLVEIVFTGHFFDESTGTASSRPVQYQH
jgi:hypothetical protein